MSASPLVAFGTMIRTGLLGYGWAPTSPAPAAARIASANSTAVPGRRFIRAL